MIKDALDVMFTLITSDADTYWKGDALKLSLEYKHFAGGIPNVMKGALVVVLVMIIMHGLHGIYRLFSSAAAPKDLDRGMKIQVFDNDPLYTKISKSIHLSFLVCFSVVMVMLSATSMAEICPLKDTVPQAAIDLARYVAPFHLVSGYGLFRRMTGVSPVSGTYMDKDTSFVPSVPARTEIVLEGFDEVSDQWHEIHFTYKPGDVFAQPKWVAPYQPRLDWQMWFAALGRSPEESPWLLGFIAKLLTTYGGDNGGGNGKVEVGEGEDRRAVVQEAASAMWRLLDEHRNGVWRNGANAPKKIRMTMYDMDFTRSNTSWARAGYPKGTKILADRPEDLCADEMNQGKIQVWHRYNGRIFGELVPESLPPLLPYLQANGIPQRPYRSRRAVYEDCLSSSKHFGESINKVAATDMAEQLGYYVSLALQRGACATILARRPVLDAIGALPFCELLGGDYCYDSGVGTKEREKRT